MAGRTIGPYVVEQRIGRGGMAEVLRAVGPDGTRVVVKRMLPHLLGDERYERMFLREARVAARLDHENVVRLLDVGQDGEDLYLVFELVDGVTLYELARRAWQAERAIPVELCIRAVADAAIGLHHAHELKEESGALANLVHRDVSPDNLMIDTKGVTRVLDFGIAKVDDAASRVSKTGELRGKLAYMSPEQAQGHALDRRSDLFSLGTTLYWLLTAQRPFTGRTDILTLRSLLEQPASMPSAVNPRVPRTLDPIVSRLLQKDPEARYRTALELHDDLLQLLPSDDAHLRAIAGGFVADILALSTTKPVESTEIVPMPGRVPSASVVLLDGDTMEDASRPKRRPPREPPAKRSAVSRAALAGVAAAVVAVAGVVVAATLWQRAAPPAPLRPTTQRRPTVVDAGLVVASAGPDVREVVVGAEGEGEGDVDVGLELAPLDPAHPRAPARKTVQIAAPAGTQLRYRGKLARGAVEVAAGAKSVTLVDGVGGQHEVPIVDGRADYGALPTGTLRVWLPPTGGEVFLGARSLGEAPVKPVDLVVGRYTVRAKSGDKVEEQRVVVGAGENAPVRFSFAK